MPHSPRGIRNHKPQNLAVANKSHSVSIHSTFHTWESRSWAVAKRAYLLSELTVLMGSFISLQGLQREGAECESKTGTQAV
jgi:hypothetical protein